MNQYLAGQALWSYINGSLENKPNITNANYPMWKQGVSQVMYWLAACVHGHMLSHIRHTNTPKRSVGELKERRQHDRPQSSMPTILWRKGVFLRRIHLLSPRWGNKERIFTPKKWTSRKEESTHTQVAWAMLHEKRMPNFYWAEAASTVVYLMNRCTTNGLHELTPNKIFVERRLILSHLKVFGSIVYAQIPNEKP